MKRLLFLLIGLLAMVALSLPQAAAQAAPTRETQRVIVEVASPGNSSAVAAEARRLGGNIRHLYTRVLDGFAADLPPQAIEALRRNPLVATVTPDAPTQTADVQTNPPWGLDRVDQRAGLDSTYGYDTTGAGVTVYVVDSGIRFSHTQYGGRVRSGYDFVDLDTDASDCAGHGTHVAGTIGGQTYGVAKSVSMVSLRVFGCNNSGSFSDTIAAFDWAVNDRSGPAIINYSGGGGAYAPLDEATARATAAGVVVVAAAMNNNADACGMSPARAPSAITVGASDSADTRAYFSNYGSCVDLFAPGVSVLSSTMTTDTSSEYWSGTSMATPHVAGAAARYLQAHPTASVAQVTAAITSAATQGVITNSLSTENDLLYTAPPAPIYTLTATKPGTGSGTISSAPTGINCGDTCSAAFASGTSVTLTATAAAGSTFGGWSGGGCSGTATSCTVAMTSAQSVTATFTASGSRFEETAAQYEGWFVWNDPLANGGSWRSSAVTNNTATFTFSGTAITWLSNRGPSRGIASITIDGVSKGTVDLYSATPAAYTRAFTGLSTGTHTVVIKVTGNKNAASSGRSVVVDGFTVGTTNTQESAGQIRYNTWAGNSSVNASGGTYRSSGTAGAQMQLTFSGTSVDWISTTGPGWGRARVLIDGVDKGTVDLYATSARWQTARTYGGLTSGTHTIVIQVLGTKNAAATSTKVAVDAFVVR